MDKIGDVASKSIFIRSKYDGPIILTENSNNPSKFRSNQFCMELYGNNRIKTSEVEGTVKPGFLSKI